MIYTVTFNPAVDYVLRADSVNIGSLTRCPSAEYSFGGKGINVAAVLRRLGCPVQAITFLGGFTGEEFRRRVKDEVPLYVIDIPGQLTRINVKLKSSDGAESELNAPGAPVGERELSRLYGKLDQLSSGDTLVLAGSIPPGLEKSVYGDIFSAYREKGIRFCADCAGDLLRSVLPYRPFLIKPNIAELEETFGCRIKNTAEAIRYADRLREMGAENVLVTMGGDGALLCASDGGVYSAKVPEGGVISAVGAGDSALAGFLAGYDLYTAPGDFPRGGGSPKDKVARFMYALRLASSCGTATARSATLADADGIESLFCRVLVQRVR